VGNVDDALLLAGAGEALVARTGTGLADASYPNSDALPDLPPRPVDGPQLEHWQAGAALSTDAAVAAAHEAALRVQANGVEPAAG
jgi:hypothetical protein